MKRHFMALATAVCIMLTGGSSGVSQEEYDSLSSDYIELKGKYDSLSREYDTLNDNYISKVEEYLDLFDKYTELVAQNEPQNNEQAAQSEVTGTELYDDEYVTINFIGFGKGASYPFENRQCLILSVENKTDTIFDFSPQSLSLDEVEVGKLVCYDSVSPHSKGKIFLIKMSNTDVDFDNTSPSKITGTISIRDSSDTGLFGSNYWYTISFIDVDL